MPSDISALVTVAGDDAPCTASEAYAAGRHAVPWQPANVVPETGANPFSALMPAVTPPREVAIASISSMKPIAPPSLRAALRSALK